MSSVDYDDYPAFNEPNQSHDDTPLLCADTERNAAEGLKAQEAIIKDAAPLPRLVLNDNILRIDDNVMHNMSVANPEILAIALDAKDGTDKEKSMTLRQSFQLYRKAVAWSILFSTAIVMEGYDTSLLGSFYAFPKFTEKYGDFISNDATPPYQLTAAWQAGLSNGALCGEILGLYAAGIIVDRFGYCYTMVGALTMMIAFIFIPFFASNLQTLLAGEILQGIPWGVFQTMTTAYASEVCPVSLRAYLTTYVVCPNYPL